MYKQISKQKVPKNYVVIGIAVPKSQAKQFLQNYNNIRRQKKLTNLK